AALPLNVNPTGDGGFRWGRNLIALAEVGIPQDLTGYNQTTGLDPGPDNTAGTADDKTFTVFNQKPGVAGKNHPVETNPPDFQSKHNGGGINLQRPLSTRGP